MRPTMWMVNHNRRNLFSHWVVDYQVAEKADAGAFTKP